MNKVFKLSTKCEVQVDFHLDPLKVTVTAGDEVFDSDSDPEAVAVASLVLPFDKWPQFARSLHPNPPINPIF